MEPLFTIITVTFNAAGVIKPTLESVAAQDCDDFELLVIDGASTDDTVALVNAAAIAGTRVLSEKDRGLYDAMNKGIGLARGRYLIFLNAGDAFAAPNVLSRLREAANDDPGVLYGQTVLIDDARQVVGKRHLTAPDVLTVDSFKRGMLVCHQAFVARRDLVPNAACLVALLEQVKREKRELLDIIKRLIVVRENVFWRKDEKTGLLFEARMIDEEFARKAVADAKAAIAGEELK